MFKSKVELPHKITKLDEDTVEVNGFIFDSIWGEMFSFVAFCDDGKGYARKSSPWKGRKNEHLHNVIMNYTPKDRRTVVDHIDGNHKNNKASNLKITTQSENCKNRLLDPYASMAYHPGRPNPWQPTVWENSKQIYFGYYPTRAAAAKARYLKLKEMGRRVMDYVEKEEVAYSPREYSKCE